MASLVGDTKNIFFSSSSNGYVNVLRNFLEHQKVVLCENLSAIVKFVLCEIFLHEPKNRVV